MKICIVTDDNSGITIQEAERIGVNLIRVPVLVDGEVFYGGRTLTNEEFYDKLKAGNDVRTSQSSPGEIIELREELLKTNDAVLHMPISNGLSEACDNAKMLARDFEGKVFVIDNHRVSVTLKSSVLDALKLIEQGKSPEEIKEYLENEAYNSRIYIVVDTLKFLKKSGRVTPAGALIGGALHVKPVLALMGQKLDAYKKCVGSKKAKATIIQAIKDDLGSALKDFSLDELSFGLAYTDNYDEALSFRKDAAQALNIPEESIEMAPLSLSVAAHVGPGAMGLTVSRCVK